MTLNGIYEVALTLMGEEYASSNAPEHPFLEERLGLCNRVLADLGLNSASDMNEEIFITIEQADAVCYGIAMFFSLYMGDALRQEVFTEIYNGKRRKCKAGIGSIRNVLP